MERYVWRDGKIRLRFTYGELSEAGVSREDLLVFEQNARRVLQNLLLDLQKRGELPPGELFAEIFPGARGAVLQIAPEESRACFFVEKTDEMLRLFPFAKKLGASLYRRRDGKGFYVISSGENAAILSEFALPCRVPRGKLKETCKRIL